MIEWGLLFLGGLAGSGHCVGMCGGFALTLGSAQPDLARNLVRQVVYGLGRVCTYALVGAIAGFGGWRLAAELTPLIQVQAWLSIAAGGLLLFQGLVAAGWLRDPLARLGKYDCGASLAFRQLLLSAGLPRIFVAGVLNGLLPCGLVYAYLALATSTGDLFHGAIVMTIFGLGTIPALTATGLGGTILVLRWRRHLVHLAGWCLVLAGLLTAARGLGFVHLPGLEPPTGCPGCRS